MSKSVLKDGDAEMILLRCGRSLMNEILFNGESAQFIIGMTILCAAACHNREPVSEEMLDTVRMFKADLQRLYGIPIKIGSSTVDYLTWTK